MFLACPDGTFGTDCSMQCGKCRGVGQCNHIDGTCKNGCEIGYSGSKCTEGKHIVNCYQYVLHCWRERNVLSNSQSVMYISINMLNQDIYSNLFFVRFFLHG